MRQLLTVWCKFEQKKGGKNELVKGEVLSILLELFPPHFRQNTHIFNDYLASAALAPAVYSYQVTMVAAVLSGNQ